jgi:hypothetical protein
MPSIRVRWLLLRLINVFMLALGILVRCGVLVIRCSAQSFNIVSRKYCLEQHKLIVFT